MIAYLNSFLVGFLIALSGLLAPSMLNMTTAKTSIERGKLAGIQFALGAAIVLMIQCSIALYFAKFLIANPNIISNLKTIAIFVFIALAIFFFKQAISEKKLEGKEKSGHPFIMGLGMASLNMLGVPFYLATATLAESKGWIQLKQPYTYFFVAGAFLGDFTLFSSYSIFAAKIAKRIDFIAKNLNYILSGIFIFLALSAIYQVFVAS